MSITFGINNLVTSEEAVKYLKSKFPDLKRHTFRNALHLGHLKPAKVEKNGNKNILFFDYASLEAYVRYRADLSTKRKLHIVKNVKSPDLTTYSCELYQNKINTILQVLTKEQLDDRVRSTIDAIYDIIRARLKDLQTNLLSDSDFNHSNNNRNTTASR
jgi:hypothetical protein